MQRITDAHLQAKVDLINRTLDRPTEPWTRADGRNVASIGNFHLSGAYGGTALHEMVTDGGGVTDVFRSGHMPKRALAERLDAFLEGIQYGRLPS